jgi:hypothetical protein
MQPRQMPLFDEATCAYNANANDLIFVHAAIWHAKSPGRKALILIWRFA